MKKKKLVTSALPYVNNIPHLGNLIQVLSADVFARYCRTAGYETLYICGTDEYGTATETRALKEGISPRELCDKFHFIHKEIYDWFHIRFDRFGRTSEPIQTKIVQEIFLRAEKNGYIREKEISQLYCVPCDRFLADRYISGSCPHCDSPNARGDQCEDCGKLLDPLELKSPRCQTCGHAPEERKTRHLYLDLPALRPLLERWIEKASREGEWNRNAVNMTKSWLKSGLKERAISRDLKWGIPIPRPGFEEKVFYVWFDAPIGYISITAGLRPDWEEWWKNPEQTELVQFIGKDNIPFHTVIFPATLLADGEPWTFLHHMSSTEYLNYEGGKFSKTRGVGIFGTDCKETGIPADVWRFYLFYNRPEKSDTLFSWQDFTDKVNGELIGNFSNLVNRTLSFLQRFYGGEIPNAPINGDFRARFLQDKETVTRLFEKAKLRDALKAVLEISSAGNKFFQEKEPWKLRKEAPDEAASVLATLAYLTRDLALMISPYIPETSRKILSFFGLPAPRGDRLQNRESQETESEESPADWERLGHWEGLEKITAPSLLFSPLEEKKIQALKERFSGIRHAAPSEPKEQALPPFSEKVCLKAGKILDVRPHPGADRLYVETVDCGEESPRSIVSGLREFYTPEELCGRSVVVAANLKPVRIRGVLSRGMLLAAENKDIPAEVLFVDDLSPGERLLPEGEAPGLLPEEPISAEEFFAYPLRVKKNTVYRGEKKLLSSKGPLKTLRVTEGTVS